MRIYLHFEKSFGLFLLNDLEILTASKGELDCFWMSSSSWSSGIHPHLQRRVKSKFPPKNVMPKKRYKRHNNGEQIISKMLFMNQRKEVSRISITMNSFMTFSFFVTAKVEMNIPTGKILRLQRYVLLKNHSKKQNLKKWRKSLLKKYSHSSRWEDIF